jgi:hypothetical protein
MWAVGCLLGTKIDCPIACTLETVNTLTPAAVRFYCTCSCSVREVAYTNGSAQHLLFPFAIVAARLFCYITTVFEGQLVGAVDVANCCLGSVCCCCVQHVNFGLFELVFHIVVLPTAAACWVLGPSGEKKCLLATF